MDILLLFYSNIYSCACFLADAIVYTTHVPSFADTWGWVMVTKKKLVENKIVCAV